VVVVEHRLYLETPHKLVELVEVVSSSSSIRTPDMDVLIW